MKLTTSKTNTLITLELSEMDIQSLLSGGELYNALSETETIKIRKEDVLRPCISTRRHGEEEERDDRWPN